MGKGGVCDKYEEVDGHFCMCAPEDSTDCRALTSKAKCMKKSKCFWRSSSERKISPDTVTRVTPKSDLWRAILDSNAVWTQEPSPGLPSPASKVGSSSSDSSED